MNACLGLIQLALSFFCLAGSVMMYQNGIEATVTPVVGAMQLSYGLFHVLSGDS